MSLIKNVLNACYVVCMVLGLVTAENTVPSLKESTVQWERQVVSHSVIAV